MQKPGATPQENANNWTALKARNFADRAKKILVAITVIIFAPLMSRFQRFLLR